MVEASGNLRIRTTVLLFALLIGCGRFGFRELPLPEKNAAGGAGEKDDSSLGPSQDADVGASSDAGLGPWDDGGAGALDDAGASTADSSTLPSDAGSDAGPLPDLPMVAEPLGAGFSESCAVRNGELWCWGEVSANSGAGSCDAPFARARVGADSDWLSVTQTDNHVCGLRSDGRLYCWGGNNVGQLGVGDIAPHVDPVAVLPTDRFRQVSAGVSHTCAIGSDYTLWCWGSNAQKAVNSGTQAYDDLPVNVSEGLRFLSVSAGRDTTCAIDLDQGLWCWGANAFGQAGQEAVNVVSPRALVTTQRRFRAVATHQHTCAIDTVGALYCWGDGQSGKLGAGSTASTFVPTRVGAALGWTGIDVDFSSSCGIEAGRVLCWGSNSSVGSTSGGFESTPVALATESDFELVSVGNHALCARRAGNVYCRGRNDFCQVTPDALAGAFVQTFTALF